MYGDAQLSLTNGDLALLAGGVALVLGILILGISGNRRGRGLLRAFGWLVLLFSVAALGYGTMRSRASSGATQVG